jgi:FkbM family methyltransferase
MKKLIKQLPGVKEAAYLLRRRIQKSKDRSQAKQYDLETIQVMQRILSENSSAIDIGANQGDILREIVKFAPNGNHWAFEPVPALADDLRNRFPKVNVFSCALAETSGRATFHVARHCPAYSSLEDRSPAFLEKIGLEDTSMELIDVELRRLDDVIPESDPIDFIKIDVEGSEPRTIEGALRTLGRCKPVVVFEAGFHGEERAHHIFEMFGSCGLQLSVMSRWLRNEPPAQSFPEFVFLSQSNYYFIAYPGESSRPD